MKSKLIFFLISFSFLTPCAFAQLYKYDPSTTEECRVRDGLPAFFRKIHAKQEVRVAYLGGSITAANGWRVKSLNWLRNQYPATRFTEINAAISGTGTGFGACRISKDVLSFEPDLVFIEFRGNGGEEVEKQSVEGVVRQIRAANPKTDICFIYSMTEAMRDAVNQGKNTAFGKVMEEVANHYGLPSIDVGIEVLKRESAGTLIFKTDSLKEGVLNFTKDGTHPGDAGHELYTEIITRNLLKMDVRTNNRSTHRIKPRLFENAWDTGDLIPIERFSKSAGWMSVDTQKDSIYTKDKPRTAGMLRGAYKCTKAGESIEVIWEGTCLGINDLTQNKPVVIEIEIDGGSPQIYSRLQNNPNALFARCKFLPEVLNGKHIARLTLKELPKGETYYVGQFLQAGPLFPKKNY